MVMSRTKNAREHVCVRCDQRFSSSALFREHVLDGECNVDRSSMLVYFQRVGVRHYACEGCEVVALRRPNGVCTCGTVWRVHGDKHGELAALADLDPARVDGRGWYAPRYFTAVLQGVNVDEAVEDRLQTLYKILAYFSGVEAEFGAAPRHQAGKLFKALMDDLNKMMGGGQGLRGMLSSMEPMDARVVQLLQASTLVALFVVPGLAALMQQYKDEHDALYLERQVSAEGSLSDKVRRHGKAAVVLDYFVLPIMERHPRKAPEDGGVYNAATAESLHKMAKTRKLSKALKYAVQRLAVEKAPGMRRMRPTKEEVEALIEEKLPTRTSMGRQQSLSEFGELPKINYLTGVMDLDGVSADERRRLTAIFGAAPLVIDEDVLVGEVARLRRSASAGPDTTTNAYIRRVMPEADVRATLLPFLRLVMGGAMNKIAFDIFGASRLVLIPKGAEAKDYRPLGIGTALYRLLNRVVVKQVMGELKPKLVPFQLALGVRDAGATIATLAQGIFEQGRKHGASCADQLGLDLKNAFGTVSRAKIHAALREYCPSLLRWFLIAYGGTTPIFHSTYGLMDQQVEVGIKQGDPLSMLLMAVVMMKPLRTIDQLIRQAGAQCSDATSGQGNSPDHQVSQGIRLLGARGYADDVWLHGDAENLLRHIDEVKDIILENTGMELQPRKSVLLLARERTDGDTIFAEAERMGVQVCVQGAVVMGIPVGTERFIEDKLGTMVEKHVGELEAVKYFSKQFQWILLLLCFNQRMTHLLRVLPLHLAQAALAEFDKMMTEKILAVMDVPELLQSDFVSRVHRMRGLPLELSGGGMRRTACDHVRVRALRMARHRVARYATECDPDRAWVLRNLWTGSFDVQTIVRAPEHADGIQHLDPLSGYLQGHVLGRIPQEALILESRDQYPDVVAGEGDVRRQADYNLTVYDLGQHTGVLRQMVSSNQINQIMAAHCLSASCANSGRPLRWLPASGWHLISNPQFVQFLRMRFGVPTVLPMGGWRCDCRPRGGVEINGAVDFERLEEMQRGDVMHGVRLEDEPFHALCCRARQVRLIQRHDAIRDLLANTLNALEGVNVVSTEPVLRGEESHGQRGDIKLVANGTEYVVDVTVACPATRHMTKTHKTATVPGAAGGVAQALKRRKYGKRLQPLVFETGGRVHRDTLQFVQDKLVNAPSSEHDYHPLQLLLFLLL